MGVGVDVGVDVDMGVGVDVDVVDRPHSATRPGDFHMRM